MSVSVTTDVHCNRCGMWAHFGVDRRARVREATRAAKAVGWTFDEHGVCQCPRCNGSNPSYWPSGHREGPPILPRAR